MRLSDRRVLVGGAVAAVVLLGTAVGLAVLVNRAQAQRWPNKWVFAGFDVVGPSGTGVRHDAGRLLVVKAGTGARYKLVGDMVEVGVPPGTRGSLDALIERLPIRSAVAVHPVVAETTAPACVSSGAEVCDAERARRYRLGSLIVTGTMIRRADVIAGEGGGWKVNFSVEDRGITDLAEATRDNVGRKLAIVADGAVVLAVKVSAPILGGHVELAGLTRQQADELAAILQFGRNDAEIRKP